MKHEINMTHEEFSEAMTGFSERLGIACGCYKLLFFNIEQNSYNESVSELWDAALVLEEYLQNTKKKFMELAENLDALE